MHNKLYSILGVVYSMKCCNVLQEYYSKVAVVAMNSVCR